MPDSRRILVIDDDRKICEAVAVRLSAARYDVRRAYDGEAGLQAVSECRPDAIVLDLRMPKLPGLEFLQKLRANDETRDIPVIVLSASAVEKRKAMDAGAYCFIAKPYDSGCLLRAIDSALSPTLGNQRDITQSCGSQQEEKAAYPGCDFKQPSLNG